jgi:hypothetical protein
VLFFCIWQAKSVLWDSWRSRVTEEGGIEFPKYCDIIFLGILCLSLRKQLINRR